MRIEVKKLAQDTNTTLSRTHASIRGMESSLEWLASNIYSTRDRLIQTQEGYDSIVNQIEEMFKNLQMISTVLSDPETFVGDRNAALTRAMHDIDSGSGSRPAPRVMRENGSSRLISAAG